MPHGQVAQSFQCHLLGMRRTAQTGQVAIRHVEHFMEVLRAYQVVVGHDAFDGRDDELVLESRLQFAQMVLQVGRWNHEDQRVVEGHDVVHVALEVNLVEVEVYTGQVAGVVAQPPEVLYLVVAPHIPPYVMGVSHHYLGYGRCPATTADNCYLAAVVHLQCFLRRDCRTC